MVWKYRFGKEFDNKLMILGVTEKKVESCRLAEKSHVQKNQELLHREGGRWN